MTYTLIRSCYNRQICYIILITILWRVLQSQTDAILGWVDKKNGQPFLMDTWLTGYSPPPLGESQDIYNTSGYIKDGITTLYFSRGRTSSDSRVSIDLTKLTICLPDVCPDAYFNFLNSQYFIRLSTCTE